MTIPLSSAVERFKKAATEYATHEHDERDCAWIHDPRNIYSKCRYNVEFREALTALSEAQAKEPEVEQVVAAKLTRTGSVGGNLWGTDDGWALPPGSYDLYAERPKPAPEVPKTTEERLADLERRVKGLEGR